MQLVAVVCCCCLAAPALGATRPRCRLARTVRASPSTRASAGLRFNHSPARFPSSISMRGGQNTINVRAGVRRPVMSTALNRLYVVSDTTPGFLPSSTPGPRRSSPTWGSVPGARHRRRFPGGELYVRNIGSNSISVFDTATNLVTATIPLTGNPRTRPSAPTSASSTCSTTRRRRSRSTTRRRGHSSVDPRRQERGFGPEQRGTRSVLVNNVDYRTVSVIDTATDTVIATVPTGAGTTSNFAEANAIWGRRGCPTPSTERSPSSTSRQHGAATVNVGARPVHAVSDASGVTSTCSTRTRTASRSWTRSPTWSRPRSPWARARGG